MRRLGGIRVPGSSLTLDRSGCGRFSRSRNLNL
jgi:hypothetical protein